jgi:nucleoside-diphosphate-sugar epimerase
VECVFHAAAMPGIGVGADVYDRVNRLGTENVLAACRSAGVRRLVYTSSPSVVFGGSDQRGVDETVPYDFDWLRANRAYYSLSKALAERAVLAANCKHSKPASAAASHLGLRDSHLIPRLMPGAVGRLRRVGDGTNLVDVTYRECCGAHLLAADALGADHPVAEATSPGGKAYFISQGEPVNCWRWMDEILALVDLPQVRKSISLKTAWRVGRVCEAAYRVLRLKDEPPMTRFLAAQLATSHWFDIGAARRDLGYVPRVSTAEGMWRLGEWLRERS